MSLKTVAAKKFAESRNLYAEHYGDMNSDDDVSGNETESPDAKLNSNVEKKKRLLKSEENKTQQMKWVFSQFPWMVHMSSISVYGVVIEP